IVVGSAHGTEDEVNDVLFFHRRGGFGLRFELGRTSGTFRIPARDEPSAIRADEQEADLALVEDPVRIPVSQLGGVAEARVEQFQRSVAVEPEGPAEADHRLVNHEGPAVLALRLIGRNWLLTDGTKDPGLFPGHRCGHYNFAAHKVIPSIELRSTSGRRRA